jgi:divalent metal cation (Fe/Co/Zn/Cd) transporter
VALLILRAAWRLTRDAVRDLMDVSLPDAEKQWIRGYLTGLRPVVRSAHRLRTRKSGATRFIDVHLVVDPTMTVLESHRIAEDASARIRERMSPANVFVHVEPCAGECGEACTSGCLLDQEEREAVKAAAGR